MISYDIILTNLENHLKVLTWMIMWWNLYFKWVDHKESYRRTIRNTFHKVIKKTNLNNFVLTVDDMCVRIYTSKQKNLHFTALCQHSPLIFETKSDHFSKFVTFIHIKLDVQPLNLV